MDNINDILSLMHQQRHEYMRDYEIDFIESMYLKIVYGRRAAEGNEEATIRKMYRIFLARKSNI